MKLFAITNRGLTVIGMLVMLLWGVILTEQHIVRQAEEAHYEYLRSQPAPPTQTGPRPTLRPLPVPISGDTVA